jgi:esterase FrsA
MTQANLSETLFKPRFKHPETSTLVRRFNQGRMPSVQSALDGKNVPHWYRMINRLMWIWRGIDPREILDVQARIVMSDVRAYRQRTLRYRGGYRGGNWIYEWSKQAMLWQQKASQEEDAALSGKHWLHAANLYSIAAYPHLKGMNWQSRLRRWRIVPYEEAAQRLPAGCVNWSSRSRRRAGDRFLHMPEGEGRSRRC